MKNTAASRRASALKRNRTAARAQRGGSGSQQAVLGNVIAFALDVTKITEFHWELDKLFPSTPKMKFLPIEEDQMHYESNLSKLLTTLTTFFAALEEGFNKAEQYEALARKSDSELAALGFSREGLPRFVMF